MRRKRLLVLLAILIALVLLYKLVVEPWGRPPRWRPRFWKHQTLLPLDLRNFFNNDGIASAVDPSDANFDCPDHPPSVPGSGYPAGWMPDGGSAFRLEKADLAFIFPVIAAKEKNNLVSGGQRVSVPPDDSTDSEGFACTELALLGAAHDGAAPGSVSLEYDDGTTEVVELTFPDWCAQPEPNVAVAIAAPFRYAWNSKKAASDREDIACHLYARSVRVDPEKSLSGIVLPDHRRLHIFAMTLRVRSPSETVAWLGDRLAGSHLSAARFSIKPPADLTGLLEELAQALEDAEGKVDRRLGRQLTWLKTQHEYLTYQLGRRIVRQGSWTERWALETHLDIRSDLDSLLAGYDPFRSRRGHSLKGYVSEIDGRIQPYAVYVPETYDETKPSPLVVHLHGHGWYRPFQGIPTYPFRDAVVCSPHGRGSMDYMFVAEEDVLACIEEMKKDYNLDPDRVYLLGSSMGGTGCWSLATKYPDRFAAIGPRCGNADSQSWTRLAGVHPEDVGRYTWLRSYVRRTLDPVTYAGNLLHVPAFFLHGDADRVVPVGNSRSMARALTLAGCPHDYREGEKGGHGWSPRRIIAEQHDFIFDARRNPAPARVRLKTAYLKYGRAYWVRVLRFRQFGRFGLVEAEVRSRSRIALRLDNVDALEIDLRRCPVDSDQEIAITINGRPGLTVTPPGGRIIVAEVGSEWKIVPGLSGLHKKPYLEGPVSDAYTRSFLVVVGTTSSDPLDREALGREADRFAEDWERLYTKPPRLKLDHEVTSADVARHNLILYGGPEHNSITALIAGRLPIRIENGAVHLADRRYTGPGVATKFCYPNPLQPERLVVVIAGARRARDVFQSNNRFGNWFQWGPYDNRVWSDYIIFDARTRSAETCLEFGFFGRNWQLDAATSWFGDPEAREATLARRTPDRHRPPDERIVYLSTLVPTAIEQHKLPVGFDTSAEGRRLSVGYPARVFRRGLGVRSPSSVTFRVNDLQRPEGRRFARFRAAVGIDLEGESEVSPWRAKREWVKFLVYGDGHLLYQTGALKWNSFPATIDVSIRHVEELELKTICSGARWLVGSAAWGNARIIREGRAGRP